MGHDASGVCLFSPGWDIVTGHYLGTYIKELHGSLYTPWLIGVIALLFLGLSAILICRLLGIKNPVCLAVVSAAIVTWPTVTSMHSYLYMATQFSFAILAACMAAYVTDRKKYGFLAGIPFLAASMACYQSEWGTCAALLLLCIVRESLNPKTKAKTLLVKCTLSAVVLIVGFLVYYGLWNAVLEVNGLTRTDYLGMNTMGYSSLSEFFTVLVSAYRRVFSFFLVPNTQSYYPFYLMVAGCIGILLALYLIATRIRQEKMQKQPTKLLVLCACLAVLPLAININEVFSKSMSTTSLSRFAWLIPFFCLPMLLATEKGQNRKQLVVRGISIAVLLLSSVNGIWGANATYLKLESNYHRSISLITQYTSRIISESGYEADTPVAIIGKPQPSVRDGFEWVEDVMGAEDTSLTYAGSIRGQIKTLNPDIHLVEDIVPYENLEEVAALSCFPANDCVIWVDDVLILKLS